MSEIKFAECTTQVAYADHIVMLREGDPWYAADPFVIARPELFTDAPKRVYGSAGPSVSGDQIPDSSAPKKSTRPAPKKHTR